MPLPAPLRAKEVLKYILQCSNVTGAGDYCASIHELEIPLGNPPVVPDNFPETM
jgi:hypothetical protein